MAEIRTIADAEPNPDNPRKIAPGRLESLHKSMEIHGDISVLVLNERTGRIVGGHQRRKRIPDDTEVRILERYDDPTDAGTVAIGTVSIDEEPFFVRVVDVPEAVERRMMVAANAHGGEFDEPALADLLTGLSEDDVDLSAAGFTDEELETLIQIPDFGPVSEDEQPRLDQREPTTCPECGHEFHP